MFTAVLILDNFPTTPLKWFYKWKMAKTSWYIPLIDCGVYRLSLSLSSLRLAPLLVKQTWKGIPTTVKSTSSFLFLVYCRCSDVFFSPLALFPVLQYTLVANTHAVEGGVSIPNTWYLCTVVVVPTRSIIINHRHYSSSSSISLLSVIFHMPAKRNAFNVSLAFTTQVKISSEHNPIEKMPEFLAKDVDSVKKNVSAPFESEFNPSEMCQLALVADTKTDPPNVLPPRC